MRPTCTSLTTAPVTQIPLSSLLRTLVLHMPNHQPVRSHAAQLSAQASLSLSGVLNILPLAIQVGNSGAANASPASPLYPATVSRYLPTSSPMENVEYSAEYHRPVVRWICSQTYALPPISVVRSEFSLRCYAQSYTTYRNACVRVSVCTSVYSQDFDHNFGPIFVMWNTEFPWYLEKKNGESIGATIDWALALKHSRSSGENQVCWGARSLRPEGRISRP